MGIIIVVLAVLGGAALLGARLLSKSAPERADDVTVDARAQPGTVDADAIARVNDSLSQEARAFVADPRAQWPRWDPVGNPAWFIDGAYERGAPNVFVTGIETESGSRVAGPLVVQLPTGEIAYALLIAWLSETTGRATTVGERWAVVRYAASAP